MTETVSSQPGIPENGRWSDILTGRLGVYTLVINLGTILFAVTTFAVVAVLPTVAHDLGGLRYYSWAFALFSVGAVIGAAATGPVRDSYGHRATLAGSGLLFTVGVAGAALAPNMETFVFWRLVQGVGGGVIASQGYGLIAEIYPHQLRGRALSLLSTAWGVATALGPAFGGVFAEFGTWEGVFWVLGGLGLVFAFLAWRVVPRSETHGGGVRLPVTRLALLAGSVLGLSLTSQVDHNGVRAALVVLALAAAAWAFRRDSLAGDPLFPRQAMAVTTEVGAAFWIMLLTMVTMVTVNLYVTLYLQVLHGVTPFAAAYIYVINSFAWTVAAVVIAAWQGVRESAAIVAGLVLLAVGLGGIGVWVQTGPVAVLAGFMVVTGLGMGLVSNPLVQRAIAAAPVAEKARTGSSVQAIRTVGQSFGAAGAGFVAAVAGLTDAATPETVGPAMEWVHGVGAAVPLVGLMIAVPLLVQGHRRMRGEG